MTRTQRLFPSALPRKTTTWAILAIALLALLRVSPAAEFLPGGDSVVASSPNNKVHAFLKLNANGDLGYAVFNRSNLVLYDSRMGITVDGFAYGTGAQQASLSEASYQGFNFPTRGNHRYALNQYNRYELTTTHASGHQLVIQIRVYDDAFAYRYVIPGEGMPTVTEEASEWNTPPESQIWTTFNTQDLPYEGWYLKFDPTPYDGPVIGPVTVELPYSTGYAVLTESGLHDYSGLKFHTAQGSPILTSRFTDDTFWPVHAGSPTPWRVTLVADTLDELVTTDVIEGLIVEPDFSYSALFPQGFETPWLKPGRALWSWLTAPDSPRDFETQKSFVDAAHTCGFEYVLVDFGWEQGFPEGDRDQFERLAELAEYAHSDGRSVDLWVWKDINELAGSSDQQEAREFFGKIEAAGAVGVKLDYLESESQTAIQFYQRLLQIAAEHQLMVNLHGANKPTGMATVYPNEMTREGLRGLEYNQPGTDPIFHTTARHNATLPFTRLVVGHGDYTPVTFDPERLNGTTFAHQLATAGIFNSPLRVFADHPDRYLAQPLALDVLKAMPTVWDETRVLAPSAIGELAIFARRSRNIWYLFGINGDAEEGRTLAGFDLSFLGRKLYDHVLLSDADRTSFARESNPEDTHLTGTDTLDLEMLPGGGFVAMFTPSAANSLPVEASSPDGSLVVRFQESQPGILSYSVHHDGQPVLLDSGLGLVVDRREYGTGIQGFSMEGPKHLKTELVRRGPYRTGTVDYHKFTLNIDEPSPESEIWQIECHVYNDGFAFRYLVPGHGTKLLSKELTTWNFPADTSVWYQDDPALSEGLYRKALLADLDTVIGGPLTAELPDSAGIAALYEAGNFDHSGQNYQTLQGSTQLSAVFLHDNEWSTLGFAPTPWRVMQVADGLDELYRSAISCHLNSHLDPKLTKAIPAGLDTAWIRPGKMICSEWAKPGSAGDYETQLRHVDMAHDLGVEYLLLEEGWEAGFSAETSTQEPFSLLTSLVDYASADGRDVKIWVQKDARSLADYIEDPDLYLYILQYYYQLIGCGVVGLKFDNFNQESEDNLDLYEALTKEAAFRGLMVCHDEIFKPSGTWYRYPNEMTRTAVLGSANPLTTPEHHAVLPFSRGLVGPYDARPLIVDNALRGTTTTVGHQLALTGIVDSPLLVLGGDPARYIADPHILSFLRRLETDWDESIVLEELSTLGGLTAIARRKGQDWFLFLLNGDASQGHELGGIDLSFLGEHLYSVSVYEDANELIDIEIPNQDPRDDRIHLQHHSPRAFGIDSSSLTIPLLPAGGAVARFERQAEGAHPSQRGFLMGFATTPERNEPVYETIRDHGDLVCHTFQDGVPWIEALDSSDYADFPSQLVADWQDLLDKDAIYIPDHPIYVVLNAIDSKSFRGLAPSWTNAGVLQPLPAGWENHGFDHPDVIQSYINYCIGVIRFFNPRYLAINMEANILLAKAPDKWDGYVAFHQAVDEALRAYIREEGLELELVCSIQYEHMMGWHADSYGYEILNGTPNILIREASRIMAHCDIIGLSSFPHMVANNRVTTGYYEPFMEIAASLGKKVAVDQTGYTSEDLVFRDVFGPGSDFVLPGTDQRQVDHMLILLDQAYHQRYEFVVNFVSIDFGSRFPEGAITTPWAFTGIKRYEDPTPEDPDDEVELLLRDKPVLQVWDAYLALEHQPHELDLAVDSDADGIPDTEDAAPLDPLVSAPHLYYQDFDRDHYGDPNQVITSTSLSPPPPYVSWGNDPNDLAMTAYPEHRPKGDRQFGIGLGDIETTAFPELEDHLVKLGADAVSLTLDWDLLETQPGQFDGPHSERLLFAAQHFARAGLKVSLNVNPVVGSRLALPEDLKAGHLAGQLPFNDPSILLRFRNLLDHLHRQLEGVELTALHLGYEVDRLLEERPAANPFWTEFRHLIADAAVHAKSLWESVHVGINVSSHGVLSEPDAVASLHAGTDLVSINYQAHDESYHAIDEREVRPHLASLVSSFPGRQIHLFEIGFPSSPGVFSSTTKQSQYLKAFFDAWDEFESSIPYAGFARLRELDGDALRQWGQVTEESADSPGHRFFGSTALLDGEGRPKTAYHTLRNLAFMRGWWRAPDSQAIRSYHLGFTQATYDHPYDPEETAEVEDWVWEQMLKNGDCFTIQLDFGVPWVEALDDDLEGDLPYSFGTNLALTKLKEKIPYDTHRVIVAISPIGNPRSTLESYWGVGQGYYLNEDFLPVPDGGNIDGGERFPPNPWNQLDFNDELIKRAFVNYAKRMIRFFDPDYLLVGLEASATLVEDAEKFEDYVELQAHVYQALKSDPEFSHVPQIVSISSTSFMRDEYGVPYKYDEQAPGLFDAQIEGLRKLVPYIDILGLSHYPHFGKYNAYYVNASMYDSLFEALEEAGAGHLPIAVTESGYTADAFDIFEIHFPSSPEKQDRYLKHMIHELTDSDHRLEFVTNWQVRDNDFSWQRRKDQADLGNLDPLFVEFEKYFRDIGLIDGDGGEDRPALARWRELLSRPVVPHELASEYGSYASWIATSFPGISEIPDILGDYSWHPQLDPDGDRRSNLFEYLANSDPLSKDGEAMLRMTRIEGEPCLELLLGRDVDNVDYRIQHSADLMSGWQSRAMTPTSVTPLGNGTTDLHRFPVSEPRLGSSYYRLSVDLIPASP